MSAAQDKMTLHIVDGLPIYDERGKVLKGPNYWKPEPKIRELLQGMSAEQDQ